MDTYSPVRPAHHTELTLQTSVATEFIDITDRVRQVVAKAGIDTGLVNLQTTHTTTGIVVNEAESRLHDDFHATLARLAPLGVAYRHDDLSRRPDVPFDEPRNGHAHCRALVLPAHACLNVVGGRLALGRWQRVFLVELDGPRERAISVVVLGVAR